MAETSILTSTKKVLGIAADYTAFDVDILMQINGVLAMLNQLGVGPSEGMHVEDATATWSDFYGTDKTWNIIQTYVYVRVKILFDPPSSHFLATAMEKQAETLEWRISMKREFDLAPTKTQPDPWWDGKHPKKPLYYNPWDDSVPIVLDGGYAN